MRMHVWRNCFQQCAVPYGTHLMPFHPEKLYNDLPLLPPKAELETKAVLRKAIVAKKALAE